MKSKQTYETNSYLACILHVIIIYFSFETDFRLLFIFLSITK
jgi:hypothetical protein